VFDTDEDRVLYLDLLHRYANMHGLGIWAYCLMANHVHLVAVPQDAQSIALCLHGAHRLHALRRNRRAGVTGHVWQGHYYSCGLDDRHLWAAVRYVERNPVRAGIVARAEDYPWSSAAAHCGSRANLLLANDFPPSHDVRDWAAWLAEPDDEAPVAAIR
jgi:putative transposase